jgi:hypothetical protein
MPQIKVHEKALAHLSRGLYRSPASALRELVSNAWDASATVVRVDTNYPNFFQISIEDNGEGFTSEEFQKLMEGGIGNSQKRPANKAIINNRPVIGRLGIGMLGIAQISGAFTVTSRTPDDRGFRARISLYDLLKEKMDSRNGSVVHADEDVIDVGMYETVPGFDPTTVRYGTSLVTDEVHPTFVGSFQRSLKHEKFKQPPLDWRKALKIPTGVRSLQELGDYWRLLWELSVCCPLRYLDREALPDDLIVAEQEKLEKYQFKAIVDGIELFKPVYLRNNPEGYTTFKIEPQKKKVYGKELEFHGYIAVQEATQLKPDELRGILVRIKNIGIGYYDPSMLDYRINEGPRSRWVTGEIFVDKGLEDALNIDRDSFNRFHPEFRAIQEYLHGVLQKEIFRVVYRKIDVRSDAKKESRERARTEHLKEVISQVTEAPVVIRQETIGEETKDTDQVPLIAKEGEVQVTLPAPDNVKTRKPYRQLASAVLAIYEVAAQQDSPEKQREVFAEMLLGLLAGW